MHIHAILHAAFEPLGIIEEWAQEQSHIVSITRTYDGEQLPKASTFDMLIIMGGPQSSLEVEKYPYLANEIALIKEAILANKPILGVCLGAQLISEALGAKPEKSPHKEVGIFPIELLDEANDDPVFKDFPKRFNVVHWHNDMPGLPNGSVVLGKSAGCPRQIVRFAPNVYGFQCHFEITSKVALGLIANCPGDLEAGLFVQSEEQMFNSNFSSINERMKMILDRFITFKK